MNEITRDTPFTERDDQYHNLSDNPLDLETNWWAINIPERRIGIWLHAAYYPNRDMVRSRVFAWDPSGYTPSRLRYYRNTEDVMPPSPDLRDIDFPNNGYSLKVLKPLMDYQSPNGNYDE